MKFIGLVSVATLLAAGIIQAASAADIPARAPVYKAAPVAPVFSWTGCYIGGHVGGGWAHKEWSDPLAINNPFTTHTADGFLAGGQIGCDYQMGVWVFGAEGQFSWANLRGESIDRDFPNETDRTKIDWLTTATGRVGYAIDRTLLYVKGGAAWVNERYEIADAAFGGAVHWDGGRSTRWGWTVGAGIEYAFAPSWSVKVEYNYLDFGSDQRNFADVLHPAVASFRNDVDQQIHTVKLGVNWRWSAMMGRY